MLQSPAARGSSLFTPEHVQATLRWLKEECDLVPCPVSNDGNCLLHALAMFVTEDMRRAIFPDGQTGSTASFRSRVCERIVTSFHIGEP
mmetsp:Transcript_55354/g.135604  ORF Transcript_55354/g.135604 Transcript_55354/m.135604 type:complete len:89 (+) Transcript_55354:526-792(+)